MRALLILALIQLGSLSLAWAKVPPNNFEPTESVVYKKTAGKDLHLHIFKPKAWKKGERYAGAVFFFGGGWVGGSPRQFYPQCHLLAERGMIAISAEYRTKKSHGTDPRMCVEDGKSAVRWLHQHAAELGIDMDRFAIGGGSAGGHVAAATHFCKGFDAEGEDKSIPTTGDALLLYNPVLDNGPGEYGHGRVKDYWKEISPAHNVAKFNPPTQSATVPPTQSTTVPPTQSTPIPPILYLLGTKDKLIPVKTAKRFEKTVTENGGKMELKLHEGAPHGFFNRPPHLEKTNEELVNFLSELGWIK